MLDELRDLFLTALKFDGNDAMPLVTKWNEAVKRVQAVFDNMTDKDPNAVPVCRCKDCRWHEDEEPGMVWCPRVIGSWVSNNWYCADGERKGGDE